MQDAAPKSSSGYGFELTIIILCHLSYFSERPDLCNTYTYNSNMQGCKYPNNTPNKVGVTGSLHVPTCPYMFVNVSVKAFRNGIPYRLYNRNIPFMGLRQFTKPIPGIHISIVVLVNP